MVVTANLNQIAQIWPVRLKLAYSVSEERRGRLIAPPLKAKLPTSQVRWLINSVFPLVMHTESFQCHDTVFN
jgi:hypothetical protein